MSEVDFYFDYSCPWTYLGFMRLREVATRNGAAIRWKPILLDELLSKVNPALDADRADTNPRRAEYQARDLQDWADFCGVTIRIPDGRPVRALAAARAAFAAAESSQMRAYSEAIFGAYFERGLDIADADIVADIAAAAGLDRASALAAASDPVRDAGIRANVDELIARGGFGSPTFFVGERMFFGNDRIPLVEFAIGQTSGRTFVVPGQHGP